MKHIKSRKIFEHQNIKDNTLLIERLERYGIVNYTISNDDTIDVDGSVDLANYNLDRIPFCFGVVSGDFYLYRNKLTSLKGSPKEVGGSFDCSSNKLKNLIGGPQEVGAYYWCIVNELESLEGCAGDIGGNLVCRHNLLEMLDCSSVITGDIRCESNRFKEEPEFFGICNEIIWK